MPLEEHWRLVDEDVVLYAPEISRDATPDEFLETEEQGHTIIAFHNVLVGCKEFSGPEDRDAWVERHPRGKRVELLNPETGERKAGNIVEVKVGEPPEDRLAAVMIYIERPLPPEDMADWVI